TISINNVIESLTIRAESCRHNEALNDLNALKDLNRLLVINPNDEVVLLNILAELLKANPFNEKILHFRAQQWISNNFKEVT
ncbi:37166_t:CDS:1, partial [Gigaspora margarita]